MKSLGFCIFMRPEAALKKKTFIHAEGILRLSWLVNWLDVWSFVTTVWSHFFEGIVWSLRLIFIYQHTGEYTVIFAVWLVQAGLWQPEWSSFPFFVVVSDTRAPLLFCPPDIDTESDAEQDSALISWQSPVAIDNSGYIPSISAEPAVISPSPFPIGVTTVNYTAEDLNKNKASCSFTVRVTGEPHSRVILQAWPIKCALCTHNLLLETWYGISSVRKSSLIWSCWPH